MNVRRPVSLLLVFALLFSVAAPAAFAHGAVASTPSFDPDLELSGLEVLSDDELAEVEGEWQLIAARAVIGAAAGAITYYITTEKEERNWKDAGKHALAGAVSGALGGLVP